MTAIQNYFICNGEPLPVAAFLDAMISGETTIYEVIKVINSKPVFFEEHLVRMQNSLQKAGIDYSAKELVHQSIVDLLRINPVQRNNIRVALVFNHDSKPQSVVVYFIPSKYPTSSDYKNGVRIATISAQRNNPTAKIEDKGLRQRANNVMEHDNLYEVLLVNAEGNITEGSRSNTFFVKGNTIITAPDNLVLGGITRDKVLNICKKNNYRVELRCLSKSELAGIDAMFITGTSPCVLPVKQCNDIVYDVNNVLISSISEQYSFEEQQSCNSLHLE